MLTNDDYTVWVKMAKSVIKKSNYYSNNIDYDAGDLVSSVYLRFIKYNTPKENLTPAYIYTSMKNLWINIIAKKTKNSKNHYEIKDDICGSENLIYESHDDDDKKYFDVRKLKLITSVINQMERDMYEICLLHFIYGKSQRKIAERIEKSNSFVQKRAKEGKKIILDAIKSKNKKGGI